MITCDPVSNSEWWCNHKFPSAQRLGAETTEKKLFDCQNRCFETDRCGGWSLRQQDGACRLYTTSGQWPYKHQMKRVSGWIAGPRWDTRQGPVEIETDPPQTDPPQTDPPQTDPPKTDPPATDGFFKKYKNLLIVAAILCVFLVMGAFMSLILVMSSSSS